MLFVVKITSCKNQHPKQKENYVTYTSKQVPVRVLQEYRSNWQAGTPEGNIPDGNVQTTKTRVPDSWGNQLSNERAIGGSPVPLKSQRVKTISR